MALQSAQPSAQGKWITEHEGFVNVWHGKATDSLSQITGSSMVELNKNTGKAEIIHDNGLKVVFDELEKFKAGLSVTTHMLLTAGVSLITGKYELKDFQKDRVPNLSVSFNMKDYALYRGYDVVPHDDSLKEKRRAKSSLDLFRNILKKDLDILLNAKLSFKETVKGRKRDFFDMHILGASGIVKGIVTLEFTQRFAQYLCMLPQTQYPLALWRLHAQAHANAYNLGIKLCEYYFMQLAKKGNRKKYNPPNLLKLGGLLEVTSLPHISTVKSTEHSWEDRIKEPLEKALDTLTQRGILKDWEYRQAKGEPRRTADFASYKEYEDSYLYFEIEEEPQAPTTALPPTTNKSP